MLLRATQIGKRTPGAGTTVWQIRTGAVGRVVVEHRGESAEIPVDALRDAPVPAPSIEALLQRDACFAQPTSDFLIEHVSAASWFTIYRCRAHSRRFLEDVRGTVALYSRFILLDEQADDAAPETIWRKYHAMSDDWLNHLGIAK